MLSWWRDRLERWCASTAARLKARRDRPAAPNHGAIDVDASCPICLRVWVELDAAFRRLDAERSPGFHRHALLAVCAWWVGHSLATNGRDPEQFFASLATALRENGIEVELSLRREPVGHIGRRPQTH